MARRSRRRIACGQNASGRGVCRLLSSFKLLYFTTSLTLPAHASFASHHKIYHNASCSLRATTIMTSATLFCAPCTVRLKKAAASRRGHRFVCALRGPTTATPIYTAIDRQPHNAFFMASFLAALQTELKRSPDICGATTRRDYDSVMRAVRELARHYGTRNEDGALRAASVRVLCAVVPPWLPPIFVNVFALRTPHLAARMCAAVTVATTQWLMGPSRISEYDPTVVEIDRCRYLEESACAGICLHSCKTATEEYFVKNMHLPLHVDPNYDDFSCKFHFGIPPPSPSEDPIYAEPCFSQCPISAPRMQLCESAAPVDVEP